jgi:hypothetical protein
MEVCFWGKAKAMPTGTTQTARNLPLRAAGSHEVCAVEDAESLHGGRAGSGSVPGEGPIGVIGMATSSVPSHPPPRGVAGAAAAAAAGVASAALAFAK